MNHINFDHLYFRLKKKNVSKVKVDLHGGGTQVNNLLMT